MGMNPRLLRPIASGLSTGQLRRDLALYLPMNETASSGDIAAGDHSGNGFTFTSVNSVLSTAGKVGNARDFVKANQTHLLGGSTSSLLQFGGGDWSLQFWLNLTGPLPTAATNAAVIARNVNSAGSFAASEFSVAMFFASGTTNISVNGANTLTFTQFGELLADTWHHIVFTNTGTTVSYYRDGNLIGTGTRTGTWLTGARHTVIGIPNTNSMATQAIDAKIDEFAKWNRTLSANDVKALYNNGNGRSLGSPDVYQQVSNADAEDWVNRVYANGGTVSTSTAAAVNTFCDAIDAAGIRDRFYRLNLFAGNSDASLNAVRTPLYRGPSLGGTQYGGTTDTNNNFVAGDYAETGASGGLTGNGTSKYLLTGLTTAALPSLATGHLSVYAATYPTSGIRGLLTSWGSGFGNPLYVLEANRNGAGDLLTAWGEDFGGRNFAAASGIGAGHLVSSRVSSTDFRVFRSGAQVGSTVTASVTPAANTGSGFAVFANYGSTIANCSDARLGSYSIGAGLDSTQAASYNTALQAFQTALGRNV
jgi:hypothetical protein